MPGYHRLRLPDAYRALLTLEARGFAWEWLRRNPDFRAAWISAGVLVRRASTLAEIAVRRSTRPLIDITQSRSARRWSHWGLGFAVDPDTPATCAPPIAWLPSLDARTLTVMRPVSWARTLGDLPYRPVAWGDRAVRVASPGGTHILIRRHRAPELALWLPAGLEPTPGKPFGLYLHPDRNHSDRVRAVEMFRRAIGLGAPLHAIPLAHAGRQAAMLCVHDRIAAGASLRDIAAELLQPMPEEWRSSSERSDLRRLADTAAEMVAGGYRRLLGSRLAV